MSGLHSREIECLARRMLYDVTPNDSTKWYSLSPIRWLGVFARDELHDLRHMQRPFALVFNTDPHDKPGQHWLAIYGPSVGPLEFFLIHLACLPLTMDFLLHSFIHALVYSHFHLLCVVMTLFIISIIGHVVSLLTKSFRFSSFVHILIYM